MLYAYNAYQPIISLLEQDIKDIAHGSAEGIIEHTRARYIEPYNRIRQQHFLLPYTSLKSHLLAKAGRFSLQLC